MAYAEFHYPEGEFHFFRETQIVLIICEKGKWIFQLSYVDGEIYDECLFQPLD